MVINIFHTNQNTAAVINFNRTQTPLGAYYVKRSFEATVWTIEPNVLKLFVVSESEVFFATSLAA